MLEIRYTTGSKPCAIDESDGLRRKVAESIKINQIWGAFLVLVVGLTAAFLTFMYELISFRYQQ